ncbi:hypothetical protein ACPCHW_05075 [Pseudomonas siliginis]|uniref:hypothetical protein n=1 Tax=Pseudomonas siliginis TaxID=2842346 RepID=UPI003C2EE27B
MLKERYDLAFALRRYAEAIASLSDDDLLKLADETYSVEVKFLRRRGKSASDVEFSKENVKELAERLISIESRDQALAFLNSNFRTKKSLDSVARLLDVPVLKSDKIDGLAEKIVEATVGARKRSEAIQGYRKNNSVVAGAESSKDSVD